jgi:signal transduction histidine kinase/CheY-like chemotaxis protein
MAQASVPLAVRRVRLELLLEKFGRGATLAAIPFATLMWVIFYVHRPSPLIIAWAALFYCVAAARFVHMGRITKRGPVPDGRLEPVLRIITIYIAITGTVWGLAPWLLMPPSDDSMYQGLMAAFILGIISTGAAVFGSHRQTVAAFHIPICIGLVSVKAWRGTPIDWVLAVIIVQYVAISLKWTFQQADLLAESLTARFEKEDLARRLARQVELVEEANREKSRFFASASHDLRQPLHAISLFTSVLERATLPAADAQTVSRLGHSVRMLSDSLDTMLDVSRLDAGAVQPRTQAVPVHELFMSLHNTFSARAQEKGLQLRVRAPGGLVVMSDPQLLERLLGNLVDNAIKYTHGGGVLVTARVKGPRARKGQVCFEITDTGPGIAPQFQQLVFDEFYQVDNPQRDRSFGLGIGLSIVRRLSELLSHPVVMQSRVGRGTRFGVWVPQAVMASDSEGLSGARSQPVFDPHRLPKRVLVLDDEEDSREALASLLGAHGCEVHAAGDVEEAECLLAGIDVEAVVADFRLPGSKSGLEFLLSLRTRLPQVQGLLVTGETTPARIAAIKASGVPCLYKPVRAEILLAALAQ